MEQHNILSTLTFFLCIKSKCQRAYLRICQGSANLVGGSFLFLGKIFFNFIHETSWSGMSASKNLAISNFAVATSFLSARKWPNGANWKMCLAACCWLTRLALWSPSANANKRLKSEFWPIPTTKKKEINKTKKIITC